MLRLALLGVSPAVLFTLLVGALLAAMVLGPSHVSDSHRPVASRVEAKAEAITILRKQPGCFVPNLGQWQHRAKFVHRSGLMTLFLEDRGWTLDLVQGQAESKAKPHEPGCSDIHPAMPDGTKVDRKTRAIALKMTFEGGANMPEIIGENKLQGHHNYFLGNDASRWRTGVPLYGSVRYGNLYPGIDLKLREMHGVPEYDLLLEPGADLSLVVVHVEGAKCLSIASDGSLVIATALGPLTQPKPKTWQVSGDGRKREVECSFTLLGANQFGFAAPGWDRDMRLTIDPGLIWSTFLGGSYLDYAHALAVDARGVVTVTGHTRSTNLPTTGGTYDPTYNGTFTHGDVFVSRLDPGKRGSAQLVYSTYLGGSGYDHANAVSADATGVVTVAGHTSSTNFPTTSGAYDTTRNGGNTEVFLCRLDPSKQGSAQLAYSTFLGGGADEYATALSVDASGLATVAGYTLSSNFPTSKGAYSATFQGPYIDVFVTRLDPAKTASAQFVYSTLIGGSGYDSANALDVDANGVVTVAGATTSTNFPTTAGVYNRTPSGAGDVFVSRLDPRKTGAAQLVYSTFLAGRKGGDARALFVNGSGVVTVAGLTSSTNFPTSVGAYNRTYSGGNSDVFVSRLDPGKRGTAQLVYSTLIGGSSYDFAHALSVNTRGVITVAGPTASSNFPTTKGAYDTSFSWSNWDVFVSRLDANKTGSAQLVYSTYLGGNAFRVGSVPDGLSVDGSGTAVVAGYTGAGDFPTTSGAYATVSNGGPVEVFVSRLSMGATLYGDVHEISLSTGGTQKLTVDAGKAHANRSYWIFGSVTGTTPGVPLGSPVGAVTIPLNPDIWTDHTIALANTAPLTNTKATLDASGTAQASINIPKVNLPGATGLVFHHAYLVYDAKKNFYMGSNPVPLKLVK